MCVVLGHGWCLGMGILACVGGLGVLYLNMYIVYSFSSPYAPLLYYFIHRVSIFTWILWISVDIHGSLSMDLYPGIFFLCSVCLVQSLLPNLIVIVVTFLEFNGILMELADSTGIFSGILMGWQRNIILE